MIEGGWLKGYRTYLIGFLMLAQAIVAWLVGDATFEQLWAQLPEILAGLGLITLRAGVESAR